MCTKTINNKYERANVVQSYAVLSALVFATVKCATISVLTETAKGKIEILNSFL